MDNNWFTIENIDGEVVLTKCSEEAEGEIVIPDGVTEIDSDNVFVHVFRNCGKLTSIIIPKSVTYISERTFWECSGLTSIIVDAENPVYDSRNNCNAIIETSTNTLIAGCKSTTIPESVTSIGHRAFSGCSGLTSIIIPNSVTEIGEYSFNGCRNLTSVHIPNSVTEIGEYSFSGCSNLTSVIIPNSVASIGNKAFWECSGLTTVNIPNSVTSIGDETFWECGGLTSINIPNSVTKIGAAAFWGCNNLTSINIPNSVTSIGNNAFFNCHGLTSINIPNSVIEIGEGAFTNCSGLTSIIVDPENPVYDSRNNCNAIIETGTNILISGCKNTTIPNSVTEIGEDAFSYRSGLTSINIPKSVTSIGVGAFSFCSGLTSIIVDPENPVFDSRNNCNAIIETSTNSLISGCKNTTIPDSVTEIGEDAFSYRSGLTSINIPNSVIEIGLGAFEGCSGLTSVTIPNSVTEISVFAFAECSSLTSVDIPNSVTSISNRAFWECSSLISITIPNSVIEIEAGAFEGCSGLISITVDSENPVYDSRNNCNAIIETSTNTLISGCKNTTIPNSVTSIGRFAFEGCSGLTSVTIPNSVTSIGSDAFRGCRNLTSIIISNSIDIISKETFSVPREYGYYDYCLSIQELVIPSSVKSIENQDWKAEIKILDFNGNIPQTDDTFKNCKIEELRVNVLRKNAIIPNDIVKAVDACSNGRIIYAAPDLCDRQSDIPGYITVTSAKTDELVDINTYYIVSIEPYEIERYHPLTGSLITCAASNVECKFQILAYEPREMVIHKIAASLANLSQKVGGIAGLLNQIETLCKDKIK